MAQPRPKTSPTVRSSRTSTDIQKPQSSACSVPQPSESQGLQDAQSFPTNPPVSVERAESAPGIISASVQVRKRAAGTSSLARTAPMALSTDKGDLAASDSRPTTSLLIGSQPIGGSALANQQARPMTSNLMRYRMFLDTGHMPQDAHAFCGTCSSTGTGSGLKRAMTAAESTRARGGGEMAGNMEMAGDLRARTAPLPAALVANQPRPLSVFTSNRAATVMERQYRDMEQVKGRERERRSELSARRRKQNMSMSLTLPTRKGAASRDSHARGRAVAGESGDGVCEQRRESRNAVLPLGETLFGMRSRILHRTSSSPSVGS